MSLTQVQISKEDLSEARIVEAPQGELAPGAVRLEVESFSLTANNITYAVVGDAFRYWDFFPPVGDEPAGRGVVPMWGHAKVIASNCDAIANGERVYGYLPMGSHLDVLPGKIDEGGFSDTSEHRQAMSPVYNQYTRLAADPEHDPEREAERMIYGPLFKTGFIIEYFLRGEGFFGAEQIVLTSASSKTALGLASVARANSPELKRIALTSSGNIDFVKETGLYDEIIAYGDLTSLDRKPAVSVDFAGNSKILAGLHQHFGDALKYSCLVGATHIEDRAGGLGKASELPGPGPILFFAPDHFVAFFKEHGPKKGGEMAAEAWHGFLDNVADTVEIVRIEGLEAAREAFVEMAKGRVDPAKGIVVEP